ncbi:MAG: phoU [Frankiales bacterium]|nr:phoU [Frankiales bacterium]
MPTRAQYRADLDRVWDALHELAELACVAITRATAALTDANLSLAEKVIADDVRLDEGRAALEDLVFTLLATQQPVASDLRLLLAAIPAGSGLERMGDLAAHVARAARVRYPDYAVPERLRDTMTQMGEVAAELAADVATAIATRDAGLAARVPDRDESMNALHGQMFVLLRTPAHRTPIPTAIDLSLLGRYYERYADQGVLVAGRVYHALTAQPPPPTPR